MAVFKLEKNSQNQLFEMAYNFNKQDLLYELDIDESLDKDDLINAIMSFVNMLCLDMSLYDIEDLITYEDYFQLNEKLLAIEDFEGNIYSLVSTGFLNPRDRETDHITLSLIKNKNERIRETVITIEYGFVEFDEDGNLGNAYQEDIDMDFEEITTDLEDVKQNLQNYIHDNKNLLLKICDKLGIEYDE